MPTRAAPKRQLSNADVMLYAAEAEECRRSFKVFVKAAWLVLEPGTPLKWNWHMDALCEHLQAVMEGDIKRIVINIGPGHTKSTIVSQAFTAWGWTRNPHIRWLCASTDLSLAIRDNRNARYLIESGWYRACYGREFLLNQTAFDMSADVNMKSYFENDHKGYRLGLSVGARGIGKRGDILLIDDPHDPREGDLQRQEVLTWYAQTWVSRLNDQEQGAMVIVGQRIHHEDLCGRVLSLGGWEHLCLPEEYEPTRKCFTSIGWCDPRDEEGELLWPEKFPRVTLDTLRKSLGSLDYSAQYQQSPVPRSGGQFKKQWFRYADETPDAYLLEQTRGIRSVLKSECWRFATLDLAISSKQTADYTVFAMWDVTPQSDLILIDLVRAHLDNPEQMRQLRVLYQRYRPEYFRIERVGYQLALIQQALSAGIPCREYNPTRDKVSRSTTAAVWMENEKFFFKKTLSELPTIETELLQFPRGAHDDIVDNCSMAADEVCSGRMPLSDGYDTPPLVQPASPDGLIPITEPIHPALREQGIPVLVTPKPVDAFEWVAKRWGDDW